MLLQRIDRARDEVRAGAKRKEQRVHRIVDRAHGGRRRARAEARGRRVLALGQPIDLVVEQQDVEIDVAADGVHGVVAADREHVAVAADHPHIERGVGELHAARDRRRAAVDGVEAVGRHVIGKARGAADARDEHHLVGRGADLGQGLPDALDDGVVAAARAPADFLIALEVLRRQCARHHGVVHGSTQFGANGGFDLGDRERPTHHFVQALGGHEILVAQHGDQLPGVHLGHDHVVEAL